MIVVKSPAELDRMRESGRLAAEVRDKTAAMIAPGVTTAEVERHAADLIRGYGAESAFLGYRGYPGHVCISVNEEVVHGIPGTRRVNVGDIVSLDVGIRYGGFIGDTATTVMVGVSDLEVIRLVETARKALDAGIDAARAGNRVSDISHAIEQVAKKAGFSVVRAFVGHGVGRNMHEDPQVPNFGKPGRGSVLKSGMTLALEPMLNMGRAEVEVMNDGWTVLTRDRKPSAHMEHTIAVRAEGQDAEVLTTSQK
jgi:methionyl aminopeptidase